jgi:arginine decarboxylase
LTVDVTGLGITGFAADQQLHETLGVTVELPSLHHLTLIVSLGNTEADIDRLVRALQILAEAASWGYQPNAISRVVPPLRVRPQTVPNPLTPRQAFFYPTQIVPIAQAIGQISAELVCPYPPGIPVLVPGEVITGEAIEYLQQILAVGGMVTGCADSSLQTVNIVQPEAGNQDARVEREWK